MCVQMSLVSPVAGATVSIDPSVTYQTIEGLGLCSPPLQMYQYYDGPFPKTAEWEPFYDTLITYMGMTMSRGFDLRACDFNPSPGVFDVDAIRHEMIRKQRLQEIADSAGETFRYAPNVFSPAPWMKRNNSCHSLIGEFSTWPRDSANSLKPDSYDDFGALCSAFIRIAIDTFHVPVYAISLQNEPEYNCPYASCTYRNALHYADMLKVVGPAVKRARPTTLIYGCENVLSVFPWWETAIVANAEAAPYLDRFAVHGATSATNVDTSECPVLRLQRERPKWLSEFNWQKIDYDSCFGMLAAMVHRLGDGGSLQAVISGGRANLWEGAGNTGGGIGGRKTFGFYFLSQVMRFVRPGMTRVKATSDEPLLRVIAFKNDARGSFAVVMVNGTNSEQQVTLSSTGTIPDSLEMRTTSSTVKFVEGEVQDGRSVVTVPARGVVSLGFRIRGPQPHEDPQTVAEWRTPTSASIRAAAQQGDVCLFDLRGRALGRSTAHGIRTRSPGAVVIQQDASGRARVEVRGVSGGR